MVKSQFLLVEWPKENKYSVIPRNTLADEISRELEDEKLVGLIVKALWQRKIHDAKVINCGCELDMDYEADTIDNEIIQQNQTNNEPVQSTSAAITTRKPLNNNLNIIQDVLSEVQSTNGKPSGELDHIKRELNAKNLEIVLLKERIANQELKIGELQGSQNNVLVEIGRNVFVKRAELDTVKTLSSTMTIYARNLFRLLFTNEELKGKSLFGKPCNANTSELKPAVDAEKRDAVISYTLKEFGIRNPIAPGSKVPFLSEIKKSLGDFIREANNKNKT